VKREKFFAVSRGGCAEAAKEKGKRFFAKNFFILEIT
jgi:hypothetical protein